MRRLIFFFVATSFLSTAPVSTGDASQTPQVEQRSFEVVANSGSRFTVVKEFFSKPFTSMPKNACTVEFTKSGIQRPHEHGNGQLQDYSLMWVQILAEVGEKVTWTCKGDR